MRILSVLIVCFPLYVFSQPCTVTNGAGCGCPDGTDTCYLLPDITISWYALQNYNGGPNEYSQTGNGANDGRLRITGSTPNIGWGPFTVRGTDYYICGTDTIYDTGGNVTCPGGSTPTNLLHQRIYKKNGPTMTYEDRWAGGQTHHPSHGHNHVDDWVSFTLRMEDPNEPDTLQWPIIGTGSKLGFCLMDYGSCSDYTGHCRDHQSYGSGTILTNNFPNYAMGGGQYSCSPAEQGISVGHTDIYDESLDGMWIDIPPNTCNGNYWIVAQVDPRNVFLESNENNNWTAIPYTLTKQLPLGSAIAEVSVDGAPFVCHGSEVTLTTDPALSYNWSNGDSTQSTTINTPGSYFVQTTSQCGTAVSDTIVIDEINSVVSVAQEDTTCVSGVLTLVATGSGIVSWYASISGGTPFLTGDTFTTPVLTASTTYYAENFSEIPGSIEFSAPHDHSGSSQFSAFHGHIIFDCFSAFTLKSVKVYTNDAGVRVIEWRNSNGDVLADTSVNIPSGTSRVELNFEITPGTDYELGTNESVNNTNFGEITPKLRRSSSGLNYPYAIPGILSLNGSPYDSPVTKYYYYFYDWEVEYGQASCISPRQPVTAFIAPLPLVTFTGLDSTYQISDGPVAISGSPAGGTFSGNGITGGTFDPFLAGIGFHTITYSYEDSLGCASEHSLTVHVKKGQITASAGTDAAICEGDNTTLTASGGTVYEWSTGDTTESISVQPASTTTYNVTVSDSFGSSDVADVTVTVNSLPVVEYAGLAEEYEVNDAPAALSGDPGGGTFSGPGIQGNIFYPQSAGVGGPYSITYAFTDQNGCANSVSKEVTVMMNVGVPVTNNLASHFSVYPNPASDLLNVDWSGSGSMEGEMRLFNSLGGNVLKRELAVSDARHIATIDLSSLAGGIYFLEITTAETSSITRVVKR